MTGSDVTRGLHHVEPFEQTTAASTAVAAQSKTADVTSGHAAAVTDQASLSASGALFAGSDSSDVRLDKVAALQKAIAAGTYNVSAADVADKLISSLTR